MSSELLRKLGNNYNLRKEPDVFGRRPATPLEIQQAMQKTTWVNKETVVFQGKRKRGR